MHMFTYLLFLTNIAFVCGIFSPTTATTTTTPTTMTSTTSTIATTITMATTPTTTPSRRTTTPRTKMTTSTTTTPTMTTPTTTPKTPRRTMTTRTTTQRTTIVTPTTTTPTMTTRTKTPTMTTPTTTPTTPRRTITTRTTTPRTTMVTMTTTTPTMTTPTTTPIKTTTSTRTTPETNIQHSDVILLNQIIMQEEILRLKLEETVSQLRAEFESMKSASDVMNRQLLENLTSVRVENENLKQELSTIKNNSVFTSEMHSCDCNLKNVTKEMKNLKTDITNMTLSLLDIQQKTDVNQGRIDKEIAILTVRLFDLENQDASILSTVQNLERIRPKVETFMNDTRDFKRVLLRIEQKQIEMERDILSLTNNETGLSKAVENLENFRLTVENFMTQFNEKVAFTATVTQEMTSKNGQTLVFPHIITNVGGGYNGHTGVFTAPRDGVYIFFCRITGAYNPDSMFFEFILNGSAKTRNLVFGRSANPYRTSFDSIVLQLRHRDKVWIKMMTGGNHYSSGTGGDQSFSGYLL